MNIFDSLFYSLKSLFEKKLERQSSWIISGKNSNDLSIISLLSECLKIEIMKIESNPNFKQKLKQIFNSFLREDFLIEIMEMVQLKMQQANEDGKSHSLMFEDDKFPIVISISVWPNCD